MPEPLMDSKQACKFLGISYDTLKRLRTHGQIPGRKVGRQWRFHRPTLEAWAREREPSMRATD